MKSRSVVIWLLLGLLFGVMSATTRAASISLTPVADAMVSSAQPTFNYGGAGAFAVAAPRLSQGGFESLLQFDLAGARNAFDLAYGAGQWQLTSAELRLNAANPNNAIFNPSAAGPIAASWLANDGWLESNGTPMAPSGSGITWDTLPSFLSAADESLGTLGFGGATSGATLYALAISPGLAGDALAGRLATIHLAPGDAAAAALFNSRTFNNSNNHPQLTLSATPVAVPEPSACLIVGLLLIGARFVTRHPGRFHS